MTRFYKLSILTAALFLALCFSLFSDTIAYANTSETNSFTCANVTQIPTVECEALIALYNSTDGPNWSRWNTPANQGWLQTNTPCGWAGVTCNNGHVTQLARWGIQLKGSIPSELGNLSKLTQLNFSFNQLNGSIPSELGNLTDLAELHLDRNRLSDSIPSEFGSLANLQKLNLGQNRLSGSIPPEFGNLKNLTHLFLNSNFLNGTVPPEIGNLTKLHGLLLNSNHSLSGFIPLEFENLTGLYSFFFNSTQLCLPNSLREWFSNINDRREEIDWPCPAEESIFIYVSSTTGGRVGSINFRDEDILVFDLQTERWNIYFDGSKVGLGRADVNAFHILDDGNILLSLNRPMKIDGVQYDDSDILLFTVDNIGAQTAGTFYLYLDGSDVQLTSGHEDIDAIGFTPTGDMIISTLGKADVGFIAQDEDLLRFEARSFGENTDGNWHPYFDGSVVGLTTSSEDVSAVWIDDKTDEIHLSALRRYSVESTGTSLSGDEDDLFICEPISLGNDSNCKLSLFWNGDDYSYDGERIDGYAIGPDPDSLFPKAASRMSHSIDGDPGINDEDNESDLTENQDDDILDEEDVKMRVYLPVANQ